MGNMDTCKVFRQYEFLCVFSDFPSVYMYKGNVGRQMASLPYESSYDDSNLSRYLWNNGSRDSDASWCRCWSSFHLCYCLSQHTTHRQCPAPPAEDAQLTLGSGCHYINKWVAKTILLSWFLISFKQQEPRKICYFLMDYISEVTFVILNLHCKLSYLPFMKSWN